MTKSNWRRFLIGAAVIMLIVAGIFAFRTYSLLEDLRADRVSDPTPTVNAQNDLQATATAQMRLCAVSADCIIGTPLTRATSVLVPTITPNLAQSKIVQRFKSGQRISVLYMGYGGAGHEGEYLTDTMLVLSYDPTSQTVTQFNIPRDLYTFVPSGSATTGYKGKINGVFSTVMKWGNGDVDVDQSGLDSRYHWTNRKEQHASAANLAANTVQNILGFKIDYWITMNFDAFRTLIDEMGGITICVERSFTDYEYPRNDNNRLDAGVMTISFLKGCQEMNGERAIQYARSRKSKGLEEGDFARSARQMRVVAAIKKKVLDSNLATNALGYMDALQDNLRISMGLQELLELAAYFGSSEGKSIAQQVLFAPEIMSGNNFLQEVDKAGVLGYVLVPQAGEDRFGDIHTWAKRAFLHSDIRREQVRIQVINSTGITGKATALSDFLDDAGFRQAQPDLGPPEDETFLVDYSNGAAKTNVKRLKQYLPNMPVYTKTADQKPYENAPDLILYMGKDYKGIITGGGSTKTPDARPLP